MVSFLQVPPSPPPPKPSAAECFSIPAYSSETQPHCLNQALGALDFKSVTNGYHNENCDGWLPYEVFYVKKLLCVKIPRPGTDRHNQHEYAVTYVPPAIMQQLAQPCEVLLPTVTFKYISVFMKHSESLKKTFPWALSKAIWIQSTHSLSFSETNFNINLSKLISPPDVSEVNNVCIFYSILHLQLNHGV
jgi:hypothetical protein